MAKHGLVSMTRAFLTSEPKVYESEGIKCYALCPTFVDTNLVRSAFKHNNDKGIVTSRGKVTSIEGLAKATKMRVMTVNEIGDAMMKSLQYDKVSHSGFEHQL